MKDEKNLRLVGNFQIEIFERTNIGFLRLHLDLVSQQNLVGGLLSYDF